MADTNVEGNRGNISNVNTSNVDQNTAVDFNLVVDPQIDTQNVLAKLSQYILPDSSQEHTKEEREIPELRKQVHEFELMDGVTLSDKEHIKKTKTRNNSDGSSHIPTEREILQEQLKNAQSAYCGVMQERVIPINMVDPQTGILVRFLSEAEQVNIYREWIGKNNRELMHALRNKNIYAPTFDMDTEQPLSENSFKLYAMLFTQHNNSIPFTEQQVNTLLQERNVLKAEHSIQSYQAYDMRMHVRYGTREVVSPIDLLREEITSIKDDVISRVNKELIKIRERITLPIKGIDQGYNDLPKLINQHIQLFEKRTLQKIPEFDLNTGEKLEPHARLAYATQIVEGTLTLTPEQKQTQRELTLLEIKKQATINESPIKNEIFDSRKTLLDILHSSRELADIPKKDQLIEELKKSYTEKNVYQRQGWSKFREYITENLSFEPDISEDEVRKTLDVFTSIYGFPEQERELAMQKWQIYRKRRETVLNFKQTSPNNIYAVQTLFGGHQRFLKNEIDITYLPSAVVLECKNMDDYIYLFTGRYDISWEGLTQEQKDEKINKASFSGGAKLGLVPNSNFENMVILIPPKTLIHSTEYRNILVHEMQHSIHSLFTLENEKKIPSTQNYEQEIETYVEHRDQQLRQRNIRRKLTDFIGNITGRNQKEIPTTVVNAVEIYLNNIARESFGRAKDEIFAYIKDGTSRIRLKELLTDKENHLYDYNYSIRENTATDVSNETLPEIATPIEKITERILVTDYDSTINQAVDIIDAFIAMGDTTDQAIAYLSMYELMQWPRALLRRVEANS